MLDPELDMFGNSSNIIVSDYSDDDYDVPYFPIKNSTTNYNLANSSDIVNLRREIYINHDDFKFTKKYNIISQDIATKSQISPSSSSLEGGRQILNIDELMKPEAKTTPEDARVISYDDRVHLLYNRVKANNLRHMYIFDTETFQEKELCALHSEKFEKNWGYFSYGKKKYVMYNLNPCSIFDITKHDKCEKININCPNIFQKLEDYFENNNLQIHFRNSSSGVNYNGKLYFLGHVVVDWNGTDYDNKFLIKGNNDFNYFKNYKKIYLGFIYTLEFNGKSFDITSITDFFQINSYKDVICFFNDLSIIDNNFYIGYGVGDDTAEVSIIPINEVKFIDVNNLNEIGFYRNYPSNKINILNLTNEFKLIARNYGFNETEMLKINMFNTGIKFIQNKLYLTCRFLYGNNRIWKGVNFIIFAELDLKANKLINTKIYYNDHKNTISQIDSNNYIANKEIENVKQKLFYINKIKQQIFKSLKESKVLILEMLNEFSNKNIFSNSPLQLKGGNIFKQEDFIKKINDINSKMNIDLNLLKNTKSDNKNIINDFFINFISNTKIIKKLMDEAQIYLNIEQEKLYSDLIEKIVVAKNIIELQYAWDFYKFPKKAILRNSQNNKFDLIPLENKNKL